jgi:hypothetical protein
MTLMDEIVDLVRQFTQQMEQAAEQDPALSRRLAFKEEAAVEFGRAVARVALRHEIEASGTGHEGAGRLGACGHEQVFIRDAVRTLRTLVGEVRYRRAYYYCRTCGASCCPNDEVLGQGPRQLSPGVERCVALVGAHLSFATSSELLEQLARISLTDRQCETVAEAVGVEADRREAVAVDEARLAPLPASVGPRPVREPRTFILEMDGVMAGLRGGTWQEVKVGVLFEVGHSVEISRGRFELLSRQRCEYHGSVEGFRERVWALLHRGGVRAEDRIVIVGDGAEWIEGIVAWLFVGATRILDFYHVSERVWAVAGLRFGAGSRQAESYAHEKLEALKAGEVASVIASFKRLKMEAEEADATRNDVVAYFDKRRQQMAYARFKAEGLPIGSGAAEGSCKYVVSARCNLAGMRWSRDGLDAVLALRCWVLNGRLDELCPKPHVPIEFKLAA